MNRRIRVLIAEDEALMAMCLAFELGDAGYEAIEPVATGEEAIEVAAETQPDVAVIDIHLAGALDGIEAAAAITKTHPIPIIFSTGYSRDQLQDRIEQARPFACLTKPIEFGELFRLIDAAAGKNGGEDA